MKVLRVVLAISALAALTCGDEVTNIYNPSTTGLVAGWVVPPDPGTTVATSDGFRETVIDEDGYFILSDLPVGAFHIIAQPPNYTRREIRGTLTTSGELLLLGDIALSHYPYPIYRTDPVDGATGVSTDHHYYTRVRLYTDERLDMADLAELTIIDPPLNGIWGENAVPEPGRTFYTFAPTENLQLQSLYTMTIAAATKMIDETEIGRDLILTFETVHLNATIHLPAESRLGGIPLGNFKPQIRMNSCVDVSAFVRAVSIEPALSGSWLPEYPCQSAQGSDGSQATRFLFFPIETLRADHEYTLHISDTVTLTGTLRLLAPVSVDFISEPFGVVDVFPSDGTAGGATWYRPKLTFNTKMNVPITEASFSLTLATGEAITGSFKWDDQRKGFEFTPTSLGRGNVYKIHLSRDARTAAGEPLKDEFTSYFAIP